MNGARFARSSRCRFFASLVALLATCGMLAIFHNSQQQLEGAREQSRTCEKQQEALNVRLQSIVEQKYDLEKLHENEREVQLETHKNLENKLKYEREIHSKERIELHARYEKLEHNMKHLRNDHSKLLAECTETKKQSSEKANLLEKKLQLLRSDLKRGRNLEDVNQWKEKYEVMLSEKQRLEIVANASDLKIAPLQQRIEELEHTVAQYESICNYKQNVGLDSRNQINKPFNLAGKTHSTYSPDRQSFNKTFFVNSFSDQKLVSPDLYIMTVSNKSLETKNVGNIDQILSTTIKTHFDEVSNYSLKNGRDIYLRNRMLSTSPFPNYSNRTAFIHSVENFQIVPKPIKTISSGTRSTHRKLEKTLNGKNAPPLKSPLEKASRDISKTSNVGVNISLKGSSSSLNIATLTPIPPQNSRKLPDNVAPIPENLEELLKNEPIDKVNNKNLDGDTDDIDAAVEYVQKSDVDIRYGNSVKNVQKRTNMKTAEKDDSGARELTNYENLNLPIEQKNFFDGVRRKDTELSMKHTADKRSDVDRLIDAEVSVGAKMVDDIDVKNHNLLGAESVNNEVIGDQGKELPDGINMEDVNDEDEDEDDYSNPAARQQGDQVIRN